MRNTLHMGTPAPGLSALVIALVFMLGASRPAHADGQEFCNETSFILYSAIAFPDQGSLISEGWTRLRPGECRTVLPAPVPPGEYFVYAHSSFSHRGGRREWAGPTPLCVDADTFSVSGLANCQSLGLDSRNFHIIDGNAPDGRRTIFTETGEYADRASLAGMQRLLMDNGLDVRVVDGYAGRRTRRAISKYLSENKIKENPGDSALVDLLEKSAARLIKETGLELCNQADGDIWTSLARRKNNLWETRGWWVVAPNSCVQLINNKIGKRDKYYLYAGLNTPDGEFTLASASETFCVSHIRFSIPGRHDCTSRGFSEAQFTKVVLDKGPLTSLTLLSEDFTGAARTRLDLQ